MALNLWTLVKGLLVQNEIDRTKEISVEVDNAASTATRTTVKSAQTANRTLNLPDASDTLVGKVTVDVLENKDMDFSTGGNNTIVADAVDIIYDNTVSGLVATDVQAAVDEVEDHVDTVETALNAHINDAVDAHDASSISNVPSGNILATDVQSALNELDGDLTAHIVDAVDAHTASAITNVPTGDLIATDVQGAVDELQADVNTRIAGPAVAVDNAIVRFDGTTGKLADNSDWTIDDGGELSPAVDISQDLGNSTKRVAVIWGTELHSDTSPLRLTTSSEQLILSVSEVDAGNVQIKNLADPTLNQDAATKFYVDNNGGSDVFSDALFRIQDDGDPTKELAFEVSAITPATTRTITVPDSNLSLSTLSGGSFANANLSNLASPTALNQHLLPSSPNSRTLGDATNYMQSVFSLGVNVSTITFREGTFATTKGAIGAFGGVPTPGGGTAEVSFRNTFNAATKDDMAVFSDSRNIGDAISTGDLLLETGNNSAGTGNSGLINIQTGTSAGGTRGNILLSAPEVVANVSTLRPSVTGGTLGTSAAHWRDLNIRDIFSFTAAGADATWLRGTAGTSPSGVSIDGALQKATNSTTPLAIYSPNKAGTGATVPILIETGNSTAGVFNSGDISLQTGTSSGGSRGSINFNALGANFANAPISSDLVPLGTRALGGTASPWNRLDLNAGSAAGLFYNSGTFHIGHGFSDGNSPFGGTPSSFIIRTTSSAASSDIEMYSSNQSGASISGDIKIGSGDNTSSSSSNNTGGIQVRTGDLTNAGNAGSSGVLTVATGNVAGAGASGDLNLQTGTGTTRGRIEMSASVIDHNQTVSEAVVWQSGATGARPGTPVLGQRFFDTTLGIPIWFDGTNWVDATGATV